MKENISQLTQELREAKSEIGKHKETIMELKEQDKWIINCRIYTSLKAIAMQINF